MKPINVNGVDAHGRPFAPGINCRECGKFVGRDGNCDLIEHGDGYRTGYPLCAKCIEAQEVQE
jgi:hypothetical protein